MSSYNYATQPKEPKYPPAKPHQQKGGSHILKLQIQIFAIFLQTLRNITFGKPQLLCNSSCNFRCCCITVQIHFIHTVPVHMVATQL